MKRLFFTVVVLAISAVGCTQQPDIESDLETSSTAGPADLATPKNTGGSVAPTTKESTPSDSTASSPLSAMEIFRETQILMKARKFNEGYESAKNAMAQFVAENNDFPWLIIESIEIPGKRIDVHFNMGARERKMPDDGIVRPLSFRVWKSGDQVELLRILDFEIGRSGGKSATAAIGEMTEYGHTNFGTVDVDVPYETIRRTVVELIEAEQQKD